MIPIKSGKYQTKIVFPMVHGHNFTVDMHETSEFIKTAPDFAIVMFDYSESSQIYAKTMLKYLADNFPTIPLVLCQAKCEEHAHDLELRKLCHQYGFQYYKVSAKLGYQVVSPVLACLRILTGNHKITFVEGYCDDEN
jgi:predicted GTPase